MRAARRAALAVFLGLGAAPGFAQNDAATVVPPAPAIVATPVNPNANPPLDVPGGAPPGLVQTPTPAAPDNSDTGVTAPPADGGAVAPLPDTGAPAAPPADSWLSAATARLGVLDEVDGSVSEVRIPVGGQARVGDLTVSVQSCLRRPPDQVPDAAVFLSAQPAPPPGGPPADAQAMPSGTPVDQSAASQADLPAAGYHGWMLRSAPGAAVVGDASESLRLIDCL